MTTIDFNYVKQVLNANGINDTYLEDNEFCIESGTEEWMDILSDVTGKDAYDDSDWTREDLDRVQEFITVMNQNGIDFC